MFWKIIFLYLNFLRNLSYGKQEQLFPRTPLLSDLYCIVPVILPCHSPFILPWSMLPCLSCLLHSACCLYSSSLPVTFPNDLSYLSFYWLVCWYFLMVPCLISKFIISTIIYFGNISHGSQQSIQTLDSSIQPSA